MSRTIILLLIVVFSVAVLAQAASTDKTSVPTGAVWVVGIDGAIGPASSDFLSRSFEKARFSDARLIIIEMNTPGGLDASMRDIIKLILASEIPVATYVSPSGSRAASAGTYILYASHIAAMAPATNLGAETPVQIGAPTMPSPPVPSAGEEEKDDQADKSTAMERKMVNDAAAYIRGLADMRGRNADWAEEAVREASSLSSAEALDMNVIDFVAEDITDLMAQIEGMSVEVNGNEIIIMIEDSVIHEEKPDWRTEILTILTNPNLVMILGMIGIYGIILEFYNPGSLVPGIIGVICLVMAGYALQMLPVNYAGLTLMLIGIVLIIAEAMVPSFGILGFGGIVAFLMGGLMLFDTDSGAFQIGWPVLGATVFVMAIVIIVTIRLALKMRKQSVTTGIDVLIGREGEVLIDFKQKGQVRIGGEIWAARSTVDVKQGDSVRVLAVDGLMLEVEKI